MAGDIIIFGEALFDAFPDGRAVLGGAPFNVAWNLKGLGAKPMFVSRVGDDGLGEEIFKAMQCHGLDATMVQIDPLHPTGSVKVSINDNEPSFDILPEQAYDYIDKDGLRDLPSADMLYHGTLAMRGSVSAKALMHIKEQSRAEVFVDINLRRPWWSEQVVERALGGSSWAKLNIDELDIIVSGPGSPQEKTNRLLKHYALRHVIVTMGGKGAFLLTSEGRRHDIAPSASADIVDTVGAGDAFSSVMLLGQMHGWPIDDTLARAQEFAQTVVGMRGATTTDKSFYQKFRDNWRV